jgi:hypothetical protein
VSGTGARLPGGDDLMGKSARISHHFFPSPVRVMGNSVSAAAAGVRSALHFKAGFDFSITSFPSFCDKFRHWTIR